MDQQPQFQCTPQANTLKTVSSPYSLVCTTTHCLFLLDLITLIVEDNEHEKPSSADIKRIVEAVNFCTWLILWHFNVLWTAQRAKGRNEGIHIQVLMSYDGTAWDLCIYDQEDAANCWFIGVDTNLTLTWLWFDTESTITWRSDEKYVTNTSQLHDLSMTRTRLLHCCLTFVWLQKDYKVVTTWLVVNLQMRVTRLSKDYHMTLSFIYLASEKETTQLDTTWWSQLEVKIL